MKTYVCKGESQLGQMADMIRELNPDELWEVEFHPFKAKRSTAQNRLLWAIYTQIAEETGHTPEEIHNALKEKFLPRQLINVGSEEVTIPGSTTKLDVAEFSDYVEQVQAFAARDLGIVL